MSAPSPLPTFIYKILDGPPPDPAPLEFPLSNLDQKDGFIHLSTARQVPNTAGLFFQGHAKLWIAKLRLEGLGLVKWEGDGEAFPHLYGRFGAREIVDVKSFEKPEGAGWKDALRREEWLE